MSFSLTEKPYSELLSFFQFLGCNLSEKTLSSSLLKKSVFPISYDRKTEVMKSERKLILSLQQTSCIGCCIRKHVLCLNLDLRAKLKNIMRQQRKIVVFFCVFPPITSFGVLLLMFWWNFISNKRDIKSFKFSRVMQSFHHCQLTKSNSVAFTNSTHILTETKLLKRTKSWLFLL